MRAGVRPCVQQNGRSTTTAYASRRTAVCATKRAVNDDGVCKQAYDRVCNETGGRRRRRMQAGVRPCVQRNGRSTTTAYASRRSSVCATYRAVNDDVVATGSNDGLSAHRGVKGLCMCDTCDLSALDSAQRN